MKAINSIHTAIPYLPWGNGYMMFQPDWAKVVELLEAGADPDEVNDFGMNLLHLLANNGGKVEKKQNYQKYLPLILEKILHVTKGVNAKMNDNPPENDIERRFEIYYIGNTPLHNAIRVGNIEMITILLSAGADIEIKNANDKNASEYTEAYCNEGKLKIRKILKKHITNKLKISGNYNDPYTTFPKADYKVAAKTLLKLDIKSIEEQIVNKGMPLNEKLYSASSKFPEDTVIGLLLNFADSYFKPDKDQRMQNMDDVMIYLITQGADVELNPKLAERVVMSQMHKTLNYLVGKGIDPNKPNYRGETLMHLAKYSPDTIEILLKAGGNSSLVPDLLQCIVDCCPNKQLRRFIEEYNITPTEEVLNRIEHYYRTNAVDYLDSVKDAANPKKANKRDWTKMTPVERVAKFENMLENRRYLARFFPDIETCNKTPEVLLRELKERQHKYNEEHRQEEEEVKRAAEERASKREFDYYLIKSDFSGYFPLLIGDDKYGPSEAAYLSFNKPVPEGHVFHLCFGPPTPSKPQFADGLVLEDSCQVFSQKIDDALSPHKFKNLQLVPAVIRGGIDEIYEDYYVANLLQRIYTFDEEKTEFDEICDFTEAWIGIEKIVLDRAVLSEIPLEDRLVYVSKEHPAFILYHKTIVDVMKSVNPVGIAFVPVEE